MEKYGIKISNYKCFNEPIGFEEIKPITLFSFAFLKIKYNIIKNEIAEIIPPHTEVYLFIIFWMVARIFLILFYLFYHLFVRSYPQMPDKKQDKKY